MTTKLEQGYAVYVHQFAVWTACRAVQRGFVKTELLKKVFEAVDLRAKIDELRKVKLDADYFDRWHLVIAAKIITTANILIKKTASKNDTSDKGKKLKMTYGRAAKMIAVYIKTSEVIREPQSRLARFAHPPVDMKLLKELRTNFGNEFGNTVYIPWTQFNEKSYFETIQVLREIQKYESLPCFWMIEKYWTP